jgi:flagellar basal body-associated protein FliL
VRAMNRRSGKKLMMIGVVVGVVVVGAVAGVLVLPKLKGKHAKTATSAGKQGDQAEGEKGKTADEKDGKKAEDQPKPQLISLGEFTVNVRGGGGLRYLQAEVAVSLTGLPEPKKGGEGAAAKAALSEAETALVKDRVVADLSAADFQAARTEVGRESLKKQIATSLGKALPDYQVKEVLFTSFAMQ